MSVYTVTAYAEAGPFKGSSEMTATTFPRATALVREYRADVVGFATRRPWEMIAPYAHLLGNCQIARADGSPIKSEQFPTGPETSMLLGIPWKRIVLTGSTGVRIVWERQKHGKFEKVSP